MTGQLQITKSEMEQGLAQGKTLTQEEWAHPKEIAWIDELVAEGKAFATPWKYKDNFQCEMRRVSGKPIQ